MSDLNSPLTDFGNEQRVLQHYPGKILYDTANKAWYLWNDKRGLWVLDSQEKIREIIKAVIRGIKLEAKAISDKADTETDPAKKKDLIEQSKAFMQWANKCQNPNKVDACIRLLQSSVSILPDSFNSNPYLYHCTNGTLDLRTGKFRQHQREDKITFTCGWEYDPAATCPNFDKFVERLFRSHKDRNSLIRFLRMEIGYSLTGDTDAQTIAILIGGGNNGKSVLLATVAQSHGGYAANLNGESLTTTSRGKIREDLAKLHGKRFISVSESAKGATIDEEIIKHITGGSNEPLCVRYLYGKSFNFFPQCKIFWSFNHLPNVEDMTHSLWRRIKTIPFDEEISDKEKRPMAEIIAEHDRERSGILNWMIAGYKDYLNVKNFDWCEAVKVRGAEYKEDVDDLAPFLDELTERCDGDGEPGSDCKIKAGELFAQYQGWAFIHGYNRPKSLTVFGNEITERIGHKNKRRITEGVHYYGIKWKKGAVFYESPRELQMKNMKRLPFEELKKSQQEN
jgi:putative DNA primase/helicase